ncbi:MAG TPA: DUF1501 domain-containing protein [Pirellulaceae bacterium]|nr:DUF1501 domain-containing protein [Pirellulaceae bacterium]
MISREQSESSPSRRAFLSQLGLGATALSTILARETRSAAGGDITGEGPAAWGALPGLPHFAAQAKNVIYLFQSGAPSQLDLFDHKPRLSELRGDDLPDSVRQGQRLTGMTATQDRFPVAPSMFKFAQHGKSGARLSELLPHTANVADELCFIKSMHTQAINHDPAVTFFQTGAQLAGRPSMGAWVSYGLGSMNQDLPTFVAMVSQSSGKAGQPLYDRLWGSGFLPTRYQGVKFRSVGDPVLYLSNPTGVSVRSRRRLLDDLAELNQLGLQEYGDPEIATRIAQYELAYRTQTSVPELTDVASESEKTFELYGPESKRPGSYAANCLLARRLVERGVRFVQLFHRGWDQHTKLPDGIRHQCQDTDQASAALISDLKQRGLLDQTLVVWGGEFGRTVYCQGKLTAVDYGRDHHPRCFTIWMAGGGIKPGITYGQTDAFGYNIDQDPVHVHDLHATMMHCLGIDHRQLTFKFQGRDFRLTDVHGRVVTDVLS